MYTEDSNTLSVSLIDNKNPDISGEDVKKEEVKKAEKIINTSLIDSKGIVNWSTLMIYLLSYFHHYG